MDGVSGGRFQLWDALFDHPRANRTKVLVTSAIFVVALAFIDVFLERDVTLGYLYIIPLAVVAGFLRRWQIVMAAVGCSLLREWGNTTAWTGDWIAHSGLIAAAFAGTGLFVRELARNQQFMLERARHLEARQRLEEQLRHAQRLEALGRLAGGVAHDFNNLLSVIIGYTDFALTKMEPESRFRKDLEMVRKAADRAVLLTRQLLMFSRRQKVQPQILEINALVANVDQMLRRLIGEDIDLELVMRPGLSKVKADPGQLEQVIMNLAVNSRDAMPNGGHLFLESDEEEIRAAGPGLPPNIQPGRYVTLAVRDTGSGITKAVQEHLFEPFFTTKEVGKGTGLGLSVVYGIMQQNGGYIWFTSAQGQGTTFTVYLPATEGVETGFTLNEPTPASGAGSILVVEDYEPVRQLAAELLRGNGYTVTEAQDAHQAMELAEQPNRNFDLLLTDVVLPQMSGRELAEQLRAHHPRLRVAFMTGYDPGGKLQDQPDGAPVLEKPFTRASLLQTVRSVLERSMPGAA